jgi:hypothetical protein
MTPLERSQYFIASLLIASMFTLLFFGIFMTEDSEPQPKFQVVDKYENCDVIRYTDTTQRWHYLFKCS